MPKLSSWASSWPHVVLGRGHQHKLSAPRRAGPASAGTCTIKQKIGAFTRTHQSHFDCRGRCRTSTSVIDMHIHLGGIGIATCLPRGKVGQGTYCPQRLSTYRSSLLSPPDTVAQLLLEGSFAERNKVRARDMVCSAISSEVCSCGIHRLLRDPRYARMRHLRNRDVHNLLRNPFDM